RKGSHQLVENARDDWPIALQVLDDLHSLQQLLPTLFQLLDLFDTSIQHRYFLADEVITRLLLLYRTFEIPDAKEHEAGSDDEHADQGSRTLLLGLFAHLVAPGEKIDLGLGWKLLRARPQAMISAGASLASAGALTLLLKAISANGLAARVWVPIF